MVSAMDDKRTEQLRWNERKTLCHYFEALKMNFLTFPKNEGGELCVRHMYS